MQIAAIYKGRVADLTTGDDYRTQIFWDIVGGTAVTRLSNMVFVDIGLRDTYTAGIAVGAKNIAETVVGYVVVFSSLITNKGNGQGFQSTAAAERSRGNGSYRVGNNKLFDFGTTIKDSCANRGKLVVQRYRGNIGATVEGTATQRCYVVRE